MSGDYYGRSTLEALYFIANIVVAIGVVASFVLSLRIYRDQRHTKRLPPPTIPIQTDFSVRDKPPTFTITAQRRSLTNGLLFSRSPHVVKWLLFTGLLSLLPILDLALVLATRGEPVTIASLFARGELLLLSGGLGASAIHNVFTSGSKFRHTKLFAATVCTLCIFSSGIFYAVIAASHGEVVPSVPMYSIALYGFTLISSCACVLLGDADEA